VWQALRAELHPHGLEIVTVALDTGGVEAARRWIEAAWPEHPSLIDQAHVVDELFGITNVPSGVWIDEHGSIVRPPEPAFPSRPSFLDRTLPADAPPRLRTRVELARRIRVEPDRYVAALRDWVQHGPASRYALGPDEVLRRSRPRPVDEATAAAHFELGQHLYRLGRRELAVEHFRRAHRLQPDNWTYKRQAWSLADPEQGPTDLYDSDWVRDVQRIGPEQYYPRLELD
jgi:tetratricopeptide (TPR) repeat protein